MCDIFRLVKIFDTIVVFQLFQLFFDTPFFFPSEANYKYRNRNPNLDIGWGLWVLWTLEVSKFRIFEASKCRSIEVSKSLFFEDLGFLLGVLLLLPGAVAFGIVGASPELFALAAAFLDGT